MESKTALTRLLECVTSTRKQQRAAELEGIRRVIVLAGDEKLTPGSVEFDEEFLHESADLMAKEKFTEADLQTNVARYLNRVEWHKLAAKRSELQSAARQAEETYRAADLAEGKRQRLAQEQLCELEFQMTRAITKSSEAVAATAELLASAEPTPEQRQVGDEITEVSRRMESLQFKLNPTPPDCLDLPGSSVSGSSGSVENHPAKLVRTLERELADKQRPLSKERRAACKKRLADAKAAVEAAEKELAQLTKKREQLGAKLAALSEENLKPENFQLIRSKMSIDERKKAYARQMGFAE